MHLLDTSTDYCSAAIRRDPDGQIVSRQVLAGQKHSLLLLPMIDDLLREAGLRLSQIGGIAYGEGPGSFTGLRIVCSVVQGIAAAHGAQVLGVSTLMSVAEQVRARHLASGGSEADCRQLVVALDARMGEVYYAPLQWQAAQQWQLLEPVRVSAPEAVMALPVSLAEGSVGQWLGCGSGFAAHGPALQRRWGAALVQAVPGQVLSADASPLVPEAASILRLATAGLLAGQGQSAEQALPVYIRDRVALKAGERR
jgi:tRNA threonylcarbamoyladenosine biosynthesis protein TsaB